ncbi:MAG: hypothetical protein NZM09_01910 [Ignavibacterium sp.]|nr:hypothetical protein [Ignavibacterium sp.]MDW8374430.1 hypothetical protein [Ignavibacteriales bacterium]
MTVEVTPQQSKLSKSVNLISDYIASDNLLSIRKNNGELSAVDSMYLFAIRVNNGNLSETLLSLTFSTVPYREVTIQMPLLNFVLNYPLTSANEKTFIKKNENLPRYLFFDSPTNEYGDMDKLAHFFGSAFLSYNSNIFDLGEFIGYFVEVFEENFKVQSKIDLRDIDVNYYGRLFGRLIKKNKKILPSQILLLRSLNIFRIKL